MVIKVTFLESIKELRVRFSVGSVMTWTIRFHHLRVQVFGHAGQVWTELYFFLLGMENLFWSPWASFLCGEVFVFRSCCQMLLTCGSECLQELKVCLCWGGYPGIHIFGLTVHFGSLSALSYHICSIYQNGDCRFVQSRNPSAVFVSSHMIKTMPSPCSAHVVWPSSQLQNVLFHHSDTYSSWFHLSKESKLGTSLIFCVRCLLTKCSLIFMITLLFLMTYFFTFRRIFSSLTVAETCFSRILIHLHLLKGFSSSKRSSSK